MYKYFLFFFDSSLAAATLAKRVTQFCTLPAVRTPRMLLHKNRRSTIVATTVVGFILNYTNIVRCKLF